MNLRFKNRLMTREREKSIIPREIGVSLHISVRQARIDGYERDNLKLWICAVSVRCGGQIRMGDSPFIRCGFVQNAALF